MKEWTTMPRRERWAWAYLVLCVLNLTYHIPDLFRGGEWGPIVGALLLLALSGGALALVHRRHTKQSK